MAVLFFIVQAFISDQAIIADIVLPATDVYNPLTNRNAARRSDGAFFIFDQFEHRILLFEPGATSPRLIARKGPGPGELERTNSMLLFNDALYVLSAGHIQVFNDDGSFRRQIRRPPGINVKKSATGWLVWKYRHDQDAVGLYLYDEDLKNPSTVAEWDENPPFSQVIRSKKTLVVPIFLDIGGHAISGDGELIYYRLPNSPKIQIFSVRQKKHLDTIRLEDQFPFDMQRGETEIAKLRERLTQNKIKGVFPDFFPYTNGMIVDRAGHLIIKRYMGKTSRLWRFDSGGKPLSPPVLTLNQMKRIVGREGANAYVSFQNPETGDMGIARMPSEHVGVFLESNPIE